MNKDLFKNADELLSECDQLVQDDKDTARDRAVIAAFNNGMPTMTTEEAEEKGIREITNHLIGYDSLATAVSQLESIYTMPERIWKIDVKGAKPEVKEEWNQRISSCMDTIIKESRKLKFKWKGMCGDAVLYGRGTLAFLDTTNWCPDHIEPKVPRRTEPLADMVAYFCIPGHIELADLHKYRNAKADGWNITALNDAIESLQGDFSYGRNQTTTSHLAEDLPDEEEHKRQENDYGTGSPRMALPVYYAFTGRPDEEGNPFDLTIIARYSQKVKDTAKKADRTLVVELYDKEKEFKSASEVLHPFYLDCNLGGKTTWHRVMGLGRLNYDNDVDVEEFFNAAMQGSKENLQRLWRAGDAAGTETLERWLSGDIGSNILPEGVDAVEVAKNPNFQYAFQVMEMLQNFSKRNASMSISNSRGERASNELEVQALERQGRNAAVLSQRMSDFYESVDTLGREIFRRFIAPGIISTEKGAREIIKFQKLLEEYGIDIAFLRKEHAEGRILVKAERNPANGDKVIQTMLFRTLLSVIDRLAPGAQQTVLRRLVAAESGDWDLAKELVPAKPDAKPDQTERANNENHAMMLRGIVGYVAPINDDDIDLMHAPEHLGALQALVAKGQAKGWDVLDAEGFKCIGAHLVQHSRNIGKSNKAVAAQIDGQLQELSKQAQEFVNALQQQQEQQQVDPVEQAKLQLKAEELGLKTRQQDELVAHRQAQQDLKERQQADKEVQSGLQREGTIGLQTMQIASQQKTEAERRLLEREKMADTRRQEAIAGEVEGKTPAN